MIRISIICFVYLIFVSCNLITNKKFQYYYYPSRNVYYDVTNAQFLYSINGGKTWDAFKKDFVKDPATLGTKQVFYSDSPQPWINNDEQVKQFNGKVYNLPEEDTSMQIDVVSNKKIAVKKISVASDSPKTEKKPGFFKRLFGGRKKNN